MRASVRSLAALAIILVAMPAYAQQDDDDGSSLDDIPHITMTGTAQADVMPDIATITLGVTTELPTATAASSENASKAQAVIDAAKTQGIAAADIGTQSFSLTQTFDELRDPQGREIGRRPRGFAAENIIAIRVHDLSKAGALAGSLIQTGANRFDGIAFSVEHPGPVLTRLTGEAVKNAREHAQAAAEAAGVKLGRVLLIERPDANGGAEPRAGRYMRMKAAPAVPIEAGTTTLSSEIEVTWALGGG